MDIILGYILNQSFPIEYGAAYLYALMLSSCKTCNAGEVT